MQVSKALEVLVFGVALAVYCTVGSARSLLAPVPAPAPAPGPGATYTVPNWQDGVAIANASLPVGGTIVIPWEGRHGVYQTTAYSCPSTFPTPNPNGEVAGPGNGGSFSYTFQESGNYYFVCQVGDHCSEGQKIAVTVA